MKFKILISFLFCYLAVLYAQEPAQTNAQAQDEIGPKPIPVTEITTSADQIYENLTKIETESEPSEKVQLIEKELPMMIDSLKVIRANPVYQNLADQSLRVLQNLNQEWIIYQKQLENWKEILVTRSQNLEKKSNDLKSIKEIWQLTSQLAKKEKAPKAIRDRVTSLLKEIGRTETEVAKRLDIVLVLQNKISQVQIDITKLMDQIRKIESDLRSQIFVVDSPPLWELFSLEGDSLGIAAQFETSWTEIIRANVAFVSANEDRFYLHLIIYIVLIAFMIFLNQKNKHNSLFNENDKLLQASAHFIARPLSAASLVALMLSIWIYPDAPTTVGEFLLFLLLFPLIRLIPGMLPAYLRNSVYILAVLFFFDLMQKNAIGFVVFQRFLLMVITVVIILTIIWLIRTQGAILKKEKQAKKSPLMIFIIILILMGISFFANLIGSVALSRTLTMGIVESIYILVTVYISAVVFSGLVMVIIRRRRQRAMQFVTTFGGQLERWARSVIYIIAFLIWTRATLRSFGLYDFLRQWFIEALEHKWTVGTVEISVNAIFDFIVILIATFVIIRFVRAFLDLEIFPRLNLPKGLPAAISMMVRYVMIGLGIFLALSALGMDLGKFGILAGALGVGLGFGLQKIVANFISSLIIAFNRLIRVGDTVKYNDVMGNVTDVGVNASTVRTFDGSEVLIPNADLISNKVTNWTLTDNRRRLQLPVKVAYGSDPHQVIELLEKVASFHPVVFKDPQPFAIFNGFQEHFLDFTLYYWIPTSAYFEASHDIALGVHDILKLNKIDTPRPWRDLKVAMDDGQKGTPAKPVAPVTRRTTMKKKTK